MKLLIPAAATAAAMLMAGPVLAVDYVQCNAMRVAYDREMTALLNQRSNRHQAGLEVVVERCGLPPIAGASEAERSSFESCRLPAYDAAVQEWSEQNGEFDPKTGKFIGSRYALNALRIYADMIKNKCLLP